MFRFTTIEEQSARGTQLHELTQSALREAQSNLDYIAMMCGVELETAADTGELSEIEKTEAERIEQVGKG